MLDEELVRLNYSRMPDGQLIRLVRDEGMSLERKALRIIREEFEKRKLSMAPFEELASRVDEVKADQAEKDRQAFADNPAKAIWAYILRELEASASFTQIAAGLKERGVEDEACEEIISDIPSQLAKAIKDKGTNMMGGILLFFLGLVFTVFSFAKAVFNGGQSFHIIYGLGIAGLAIFFRNRSARKKLIRLQQHLEAALAFGRPDDV